MLILVVGVLVLLAISATVYVSVGRMERLQATAQESHMVRNEAAAKVVAHIGDLLALDLFGNDPTALKPFGDGERWDYPSTGAGTDFNVRADPWLASAEAVAPLSLGGAAREAAPWTTWPHFSNIHPNGRFVALDRLFSGDGIYEPSLFISANPSSLDTRDIWAGEAQRELRFDIQLDDIDPTSSGYVTMADRVLGTDTDGDGRIDARWTELPELYGLPDGMRMFVAARIIDLSSAMNVNTNIELGLTQSGAGTAGTGRYPSDVDLYSMLFDEFLNIHFYRGLPTNRAALEADFVEQGYREHLKSLGFFDASYQPANYIPQLRLPVDRRNLSYVDFGREGGGAFSERLRYSTSDELDLRSFWGTSNDRATSLLELRFTGLNGGDPEDPLDWLSPFRDLFPTQLDWVEGSPTNLDIQTDVRRLTTTHGGARPIRPWNLQDPEEDPTSHAVLLKPRLDQILDGMPNLEKQQSLMSGLMWSLAPYAIRHSEAGGTQVNLFYDPLRPRVEHEARWAPPTSNIDFNYGGGDATFAYTRAAMVATNAQDWADEDDDPTIRRLRFDQALPEVSPLNPDGWEIGGNFEFGRIPDGVSINQNPVALIGLERQPFLREAATLAFYFDSNTGDGVYGVDPNNPSDVYLEAIAFELGNPWDTSIDLSEYEIGVGKVGEVPQIFFPIAGAEQVVLAPGETIVLYSATSLENVDPTGLDRWIQIINDRAGSATELDYVHRLVDNLDTLEIEPDMDSVTLWRRTLDFQGTNNVPRVLVDRLDAGDPGNVAPTRFPNMPDDPFNYFTLVNPPGPEGYFIGLMGSMRRYSEQSPDGQGFPGYVLQSPELLDQFGREGSRAAVQAADITTPPANFLGTTLRVVDFLNSDDDLKGYSANALVFPAFEFHVANFEEATEIQTPADLLLVNSVTHVMFADPNVITNFENPANYTTLSEMLADENAGTRYSRGADAIGFRFGPNMADFRLRAGAASANPFMGKLDFTRYIPRNQDQAIARNVAKDITVPLAARVLDAFDTVPTSSSNGLVQGRINLNTAPRRVLEGLPYLFPQYQAGELRRGRANLNDFPTWQRDSNDLKIAQHLVAYRDRFDTWDDGFLYEPIGGDYTQRGDETLLTVIPGDTNSDGLRKDSIEARGFASLGELPLLSRWQWDNARQAYRPISATTEDPLQAMTLLGFDTQNLSFERLAANPETFADFDPVDDPTEWLALTRAVSSSVDVRSDVFAAYLNIMAVSEDDLREAVGEADRLGYSNPLEVLKPTIDQRYLVIFDRSNVERPSDRPRLLFGVRELPQW